MIDIRPLVAQATRARGPNKPAEFDTEYFAELVANECAYLCTEDYGTSDGWGPYNGRCKVCCTN